ncbi:alpha/beta hydrolase [Actinomycetaceae bacterium L2_0104]
MVSLFPDKLGGLWHDVGLAKGKPLSATRGGSPARLDSRDDAPLTSTFSDDDAMMVYTRMGRPRRRAYVLVHGIGMGRAVFARLAAALARSGRVYGVDLPGFGDSPRPTQSWSMTHYGDLLAAFIENVVRQDSPPQEIVLVGHSMGTEVAVEAAARHLNSVDALVLIAPTVNASERTATRQVMRMVQDLYDESLRVLANGFIQYLKANPLWFLKVLNVMLHHKVETILPRITTPTLVLRGEDDWVCPSSWVKEVAELIPGARYAEAKGHGHEAMIRSASPVVGMIVEFLDEM